jgi:hypothetical protein
MLPYSIEFQRKPTSAQIAKVLRDARDAGHTEAKVMRGEAGYCFRFDGREWAVSYAPGGGHTITYAMVMKALTLDMKRYGKLAAWNEVTE